MTTFGLNCFGILAVVALAAVGLGMTAHAAPKASAHKASLPLPTSGAQGRTRRVIEHSGEAAYGAVLAGRWSEAETVANQIVAAEARLPMNYGSWKAQFGLERNICSLQMAIASRDRWEAARAANRVTLYVSRLARQENAPWPSELQEIEAYGRELQVAGKQGNAVAARKALGRLDAAWIQLRPTLVKSASKGTEQRFESLLAAGRAMNSAQQLNTLSVNLLGEVDHLEEVFGSENCWQ